MPRPSNIVGLVLAGGLSRRFGSEKAAALLQGRPLLHWALAHLEPVCSALAVNATPGSRAEALARAADRAVVHDAPGDAAGPLTGIRAGLIWARTMDADILAVEPCDTPRLPPGLHADLICALGDAPVAMAQTADGPQPLCAVWRVEALQAVTAALADGAHPSIWRFIDGVGGVRLSFDDASAFQDANTPDRLATLTQPRS